MNGITVVYPPRYCRLFLDNPSPDDERINLEQTFRRGIGQLDISTIISLTENLNRETQVVGYINVYRAFMLSS